MDLDQERQWAEEKRVCLERWIEREAVRIAALPSLEERRAALATYQPDRPARLLERIQERMAALWAARAGR